MISWPNKYVFNKIIILWRKKNTQKIPDKENYYLQTNLNQFLQLPAKIYKISVDKPIIILMLPKNGFVLNTYIVVIRTQKLRTSHLETPNNPSFSNLKIFWQRTKQTKASTSKTKKVNQYYMYYLCWSSLNLTYQVPPLPRWVLEDLNLFKICWLSEDKCKLKRF